MPPSRDSTRLRHMLEHAEEAVDLAAGTTRASLDANRLLELALTRLVQIVGEAAARVTVETRATLPQVPWPEIVGLRNRLVHGYDAVDLDILWTIIQHDIPPLIDALRANLLHRSQS